MTTTLSGYILPLVCVSLGIGGLLSLFALIPPIRKWGRANTTRRRKTCWLFGVVAFALTFGLWTQAWVQLIYLEQYDGEGVCQCSESPTYVDPTEVKQHKNALRLELWLRTVTPPGLTQGCYSNQAEVCRIADKIPRGYHVKTQDWGRYFFVRQHWANVCGGMRSIRLALASPGKIIGGKIYVR
jgi:hypothetical protein